MICYCFRVIRLRKWYASCVSAAFFSFATSMAVVFCNTHIRIYYNGNEDDWKAESRQSNKGVIVIANHRTRIDWIFVGWCYSYFINKAATLKIILATTLKYWPFFGWSMQVLSFIFLTRERKNDLPHIARSMSYSLNVEPSAPCVLIFPEGTDLAPVNQEKGDAFLQTKQEKLAEQTQEGIVNTRLDSELRWFKSPRRFTLFPKTAGLDCIVQQYIKYFREHSGPSTAVATPRDEKVPVKTQMVDMDTAPCIVLHDLTIAYKDSVFGVRSSDLSLLRGEFPPEVHIYVRKSRIPIEKQAREQQLQDGDWKQISSDGDATAVDDGTCEDAGAVFAKIEHYLHDSFLWKELLLSQYYSHINTSQISNCTPPINITAMREALESTGTVTSTGSSSGTHRNMASMFDTRALLQETEQAQTAEKEKGAEGLIQWPNVVCDSNNHYFKLSVILFCSCVVFAAVLFALLGYFELRSLFFKTCAMYMIVGFVGQGIDMIELKYHWDYICNKTVLDKKK